MKSHIGKIWLSWLSERDVVLCFMNVQFRPMLKVYGYE